MMEFTLSRVVMAVCGLMVMAAVVGPFSNILENRTDAAGLEAVDSITVLFDTLSEKGEGTSYFLRCSDLLPSSQWHLVLEGRKVTLFQGDRAYISYAETELTEASLVLGYNDVLAVTVVDGPRLHLQKVSETFASASISLCMSSQSL
ncbi:MAG: hypothetical protein AB7E27_03590 [Candidatus Methanomethylophilaceae archaeon]